MGHIIAYIESETNHGIVAKTLICMELKTKKVVYRRKLPYNVVLPVAISPNNRLIALIFNSTDTKRPIRPILQIIRIADNKVIFSTKDTAIALPSWAEDSNKIAYQRSDGACMILNLRHKLQIKLPHSGKPIWSPNKNWIILDASYIYDINNKTTINLNLPEKAIVLGWSPDSKALLFTKEEFPMRYPLYAYIIKSSSYRRLGLEGSALIEYPVLWRE
jgi:Tol biopolymer transport system component